MWYKQFENSNNYIHVLVDRHNKTCQFQTLTYRIFGLKKKSIVVEKCSSSHGTCKVKHGGGSMFIKNQV